MAFTRPEVEKEYNIYPGEGNSFTISFDSNTLSEIRTGYTHLVVYYTTGDTTIRELIPLHDEWDYNVLCEKSGIYKVKFGFLDSKGVESQLTDTKKKGINIPIIDPKYSLSSRITIGFSGKKFFHGDFFGKNTR